MPETAGDFRFVDGLGVPHGGRDRLISESDVKDRLLGEDLTGKTRQTPTANSSTKPIDLGAG